jgi:hypothetical protein
MGTLPDPLPDRAPLVMPQTDLISPDWYRWLSVIRALVGAAAQRLGNDIVLLDQAAAIPTTPWPLPPLTRGLYRVSAYGRVATAGSTSSSITVTIGWTERGVALTTSSPALTTNSLTATLLWSVPILIDGNTPITYAVDYKSTGGTQMRYDLGLAIESV